MWSYPTAGWPIRKPASNPGGTCSRRTFPDNKVGNRPYKIFFASGDWTCSVSLFTGTMTGPMIGADSSEIPPTGKSFAIDLFTVARWDDGQTVEENLMYDLVTFMKQIGLSE